MIIKDASLQSSAGGKIHRRFASAQGAVLQAHQAGRVREVADEGVPVDALFFFDLSRSGRLGRDLQMREFRIKISQLKPPVSGERFQTSGRSEEHTSELQS